MRDRDIVAAITAADPAGLSGAYDHYAAGLYAYCRCLLGEPADAADAVQDTFVIAAAKLSALRDPDRLRPWLYAVARNESRRRLRARRSAVSLDEAAAVTIDHADPGTELEQAELRELVWSSLAGLTESEREIIELILGHELDGADLADALGVPRNQAHAMASRARAHFEAALGVLLVARGGQGTCAELDAMLAGWDGRLSVLLRKRLGRHIRRCASCGDRQRRELAPGALLRGFPVAALPLAGLPVSLRCQVLGLVADPAPDAAARRLAIGQRAGPLGPAGFPKPLDPPVRVRLHHQLLARPPLAGHPLARQLLDSQHARAGAAAAGGAALISGALLGGGLLHHPGSPPGAPGPRAQPAPAATGAPAAAPVVPGPGGQPTLAAPGGRPAAAAPGRASTGGSAGASSASSASGRGGSGSPAPPAAGGPSPAAGAVVAGTLSVSPASLGLALSLGGSWTGTLTLTATGGPVAYHITVPAPYLQKLTISAPSGQLAAGQHKRVAVTAASGGLFSTAILTLQPGGLHVAISYQIGV